MDLDDFFAKKDRKKSKGKKFATADEIAKKLEESGRRSEKLKKEKKEEVDEQGNTVVQDEDEWREFEEEKKDYSGLKIQNLTLADYDNWEEGGSGGEDEEGGMEENEQGEMVPKKKAGPWRVIQNPTPAVAEEEPAPVAAAVQPQPPQQQSSSTYVPPSLRNANRTSAASSTPFNQKLMRRKVAPDVRSEEAFPTLSAATAQEAAGASAWSKNRKTNQELGFEEVRNSKSHSGRSIAAQSTVSLGNKYGALEDES
uniref:Protein CDV3 n=1 Tax=Lygus hesperus TaxID=30085 RepID=A0A0A9YQB2_LYGHE